MNYWTQSKDHVYVAAHRGWPARYPENTMISFKAALDLGVDQIETDIRITKDGELVLIHDATVDRTTNGSGKVADFTFEELQALDAGIKKGEEFAGTKIPTLRQLFELVKDHPTITLDLELKEYPTPGWEKVSYEVCDRTLAMVEEYGFGDRIVLNTFSGPLHDYIYKTWGGKYRQHVYYPITHHAGMENDPYKIGYCVCMFGGDCGMASVKEFEDMRQNGIRTWAGASVKDEATVRMAIEREAELITCNNPDQILALLEKMGKR